METQARRTLCVGDVHGMRQELERLLEIANYQPGADRLVFLGDLVDRGPDPVGTVRFVRKLMSEGDVQLILGNHEEKMLRYLDRESREREQGIPNKMQKPRPERLTEWHALDADEVAWLKAQPFWLRLQAGDETWLALHGGLEVGIPIEKQKNDKICRVRFVDDKTGKHKGQDNDFSKAPEGASEWMTRWEGPENIVCGHAVHSRKTPRVDRPKPGVEVWSIDTGGCFGGKLTALVLESREVFQVQAERSYGKLLVQLPDETEPRI